MKVKMAGIAIFTFMVFYYVLKNLGTRVPEGSDNQAIFLLPLYQAGYYQTLTNSALCFDVSTATFIYLCKVSPGKTTKCTLLL